MNQNLSLYIHIPFCKRKCKYCDFLSMPCEAEKRDLYVQALCMELESYKESDLAKRKIHSIFLGGGTPTVLSSEQIRKILEKIKSIFNNFENDCEITMELNPGTVSKEDCFAYQKMGVNRISIGLQSTNDKELAKLGRIHDFQTFLTTYQWLKEAGFARINVDLMSALPGQTISSYEKTLEEVLRLRPSHISAYSLIIEEGTEFENLYGEEGPLQKELPNEDDEREMYARTKQLLAKQGYHRYEISNYALEGQECRHNLVYWKRGEYLGIGLGSASFLNEIRSRNEVDLDRYIENWMSGIRPSDDEREQLSKEDAMAEFLFLGLRLMEGVSEDKFFRQFGVSLTEIYGQEIQKYLTLGMLTWYERQTERWLRLTEQGIDVSNKIFADFLR